MNHVFMPGTGPIVLPVRLLGPKCELVVRLVLDTGATMTMIRRNTLLAAGYVTGIAELTHQIHSATGTQTVEVVHVERIATLGAERTDHVVACHDLPADIPVHGILGLDFLQGHRLTIDFNAGLLSLE